MFALRLGWLPGAEFSIKDPDVRVSAGKDLGDTWSFDPSTARWTSVGNLGPSPSDGTAGQLALATADGGDGRSRIYLFSGYSSSQDDSTRTSQRLHTKLSLAFTERCSTKTMLHKIGVDFVVVA
jgi:hypothetical protein